MDDSPVNPRVSKDSVLTVEGDRIVLASPYDPDLVKDCRSIPGRDWLSIKKVNTWPINSSVMVKELANRWGISIPDDLTALDDVEMPRLYGVWVEDDRVKIRFEYNAEVVKDIHQIIPEAVFKRSEKYWWTTLGNLPQAIHFGQKHDLEIEPRLREQLVRERQEAKDRYESSYATDADIDVKTEVELLPYQRAGVKHLLENRRTILADDMGLGKLQPVTEPVLTPAGWTPIGDLRRGDEVIGSDGRPTAVTGVFPQGEMEIVRVNFSDGSWTDCGWDHLWTVRSPYEREFVLTTRQMFNGDLITHQEQTGEGLRVKRSYTMNASVRTTDNQRRWHIPMVEAPLLPAKTFPVEPYMLGIYLGDGSWSSGSCTLSLNGDDADDIVQSLGDFRPRPLEGRNSAEVTMGVQYGKGIGNLGLAGCRSWEKFVPTEYLTGSPNQRLALLQGLMDTDGEAMKKGGAGFSSTSENLADAVVNLFQSLGGIAKKSGPRITKYSLHGVKKDGRPSWRVNGKLPSHLEPFRVSRKLTDWVRPTKYPARRMIDSIEETGRFEDSVCIKVAARDELYVTRFYVLTHNTCQALVAANMVGQFPCIVVSPNTLKLNWEAEVEKFTPWLTVNVVSGGKREEIEPADIVVINYDIIAKRADDVIALGPQALIGDELHAIKNTRSQYVCPMCAGKLKVNSRNCPHCKARDITVVEKWSVKRGEGFMRVAAALPLDAPIFALTGTPVTNRPIELVPLLTATGRIDEFGGRWRFINRYCGGGTGATNLMELNRKLRETGAMIRRTKKEIFAELPPLRNAIQYMQVDEADLAEYRRIEADVVEFLAQRAREIAEEAGEDPDGAYWEKRMRAEAAEHLVRISVLKGAVVDLKHKSVVSWLDNFLEESDEKIIVFAERVEIVEKLAEHFGDSAVKIRGGVKNEDRMAAVKRFQEDPTCRVFVGNMAAAAEGITLTAASNVAFVEQAWSPSTHAQCAARSYGRVQNLHGAVAWYLLVKGTIDSDINTLLSKKAEIIDAVMDGVSVEKQGSILGDLTINLARRGLQEKKEAA